MVNFVLMTAISIPVKIAYNMHGRIELTRRTIDWIKTTRGHPSRRTSQDRSLPP